MPRGFDGTIRIDSSISTSGFNKGIKDLSGGLKPVLGLLTKIGAAIGVAFSVKLVADFTASVTKLAAEFERLQISALAVGQLHGIAAEETSRLVDELTSSGVQSDIANRAFINFAQNGLDQNLLPALARGAQDLAVFAGTGETSSDILDRLAYGILSLNTLMLRRANVAVDVNEAEKQFASNLGLTSEQLTIQQKRQAVTLAVLEKLKDVQGLYTLSQKTAAGQLSSNVRIMNEFRAAIGSAFQGAFFKLIKGWNDLVKVMTASIKEGGRLNALFVKIGTVAAFLADIIGGLFRAIASLFGVDLSNAVDTASGQLDENAVSAEGAADAQTNLANATEEAGKAAKGALASFDELNVLQQDTGGAGTDAGLEDAGFPDTAATDFSGLLEEIEAKQKAIQDRVDELKKRFLDFIQPISDAFYRYLLPPIRRIVEALGTGLKWVWDNILIPFGTWIKDELVPRILELGGVWLDIFGITIEELGPILANFWENYLKPGADILGGILLQALDGVIARMKDLRTWIRENEGAWNAILIVLGIVLGLFLAFTTPIGAILLLLGGLIFILANVGKAWQIFTGLLEQGLLLAFNVGKLLGTRLRDTLIRAFESVRNFVKGIFNQIISYINGLISRVTNGINSIVYAANSVGGILPGFSPVGYVSAPRIPYLATGAVIPPNAQFAAVLGDQTSGRNLEAPEGLIRQIIREELGSIDANIEIGFNGSIGALIQELKPRLDKENVRIGGSLVKSGATS